MDTHDSYFVNVSPFFRVKRMEIFYSKKSNVILFSIDNRPGFFGFYFFDHSVTPKHATRVHIIAHRSFTNFNTTNINNENGTTTINRFEMITQSKYSGCNLISSTNRRAVSYNYEPRTIANGRNSKIYGQ